MGIPGLYRWLVDRYPNTLCCVADDHGIFRGDSKVDTTQPNPNGVEFDNLYIDMNGIIHPCFHPEGMPAPRSYEQVFKFIFRYIERVFAIARPRKLLFLAVDGVAPRAKMNHQRIRRFRAAKEAAGKVSAVQVEGIDQSEGDKKLDSNVITPGTEFMALLSSALNYFVHRRMNVDPGWRNIKVILSDSSVVGEGEHKIMSFIRSQRNLPGYDPNTRHCLHGLDADLIMLALATHEIHFSILREITTRSQTSAKEKSKLLKNRLDGKSNRKTSYGQCMREFLHNLKFEFFNIWVLREYLERELLPNINGADFERLVDDFVFICLFAGNDFLPHLPSVDISEGGIELLLIVYQAEFVKMGYLTDSSKVNLKSMEHFLQALGSHENAIFMKRCQVMMERKRKRKRSDSQDSLSYVPKKKERSSKESSSNSDQPSMVELQSITMPNDVDSTTDEVKIHNKYNQRYYTEKFDGTNHDFNRIKRDAVLKYTEGICWVMHYYYQGVCSWQWFYPYHYAPFASDFCGLDKLEVHFTLGQPFKPLDQLLGVLPAASAQALPLFYRELMTKASSPILDFYPKDAKIDKNGKKHAWQGVCKLPFIEESRLLSETVKVEHTLTDEEKQRNMLGRDRLFVHRFHPLAKVIKNHPLSDPNLEFQIKVKPELSGGMNGYVCISDKPVHPCKIPSPVDGQSMINENKVISVDYKYPSFHAHIPRLPCGIIMPPKILRCHDSPHPPVLWHATPGLSRTIFSERPIKKSKTKKRKHDEVRKSCINENLAHAIETEMQDHCIDNTLALVVELGMAPEQLGSKHGASESYVNNEARDGKQNSYDGVTSTALVGNLEGELQLVEGRKMICGASQTTSIVEAGKDLTSMIESDLLSARKQEFMVGNDEHGINYEAQTNKQLEDDDTLVDGTNINKSGADTRSMDGTEGKEKITDLSIGNIDIQICEKPTKRIDFGLASTWEHEIMGRENKLDIGVEPRRKQEKKRVEDDRLEAELHLVEGKDKVNGLSQKSINVEACEKPKHRLESDLLFLRERETVGGENEEDTSGKHKRKKLKRKQVKGDMLGSELLMVEEKVEIVRASQSSNKVEVREIPSNRVEPDFLFSREEEKAGRENGGSTGVPKRKKQKKRRQIHGVLS